MDGGKIQSTRAGKSMNAKIAARYYRLGLASARRRNLSAALRYASCAWLLDPGHDDAARLVEICRYELDGNIEEAREPSFERLGVLVGKKSWKAAAKAVRHVPHQSVWLLNVQGCLWALAKRYARAADCFARALAKDRGNVLAADALAELGQRRTCFWRFF
jgi:tetratricopeptide (TPR) repeat protein